MKYVIRIEIVNGIFEEKEIHQGYDPDVYFFRVLDDVRQNGVTIAHLEEESERIVWYAPSQVTSIRLTEKK